MKNMDRESRYKKVLILPALLFSAVFLVACGGAENSVKDNTVKQTGQFIDAPVGNVDIYQSGLKVSTTDSQGYFQYTDGVDISFQLGKLVLGSTSPKKIITPLNLSNNKTDVVEILVVLQSLDEDKNPDNGIYILDETKQKLKTSLDLSKSNVTVKNTVLKDIPSLSLVSSDNAVKHFKQSAKQYNISTSMLDTASTPVSSPASNSTSNSTNSSSGGLSSNSIGSVEQSSNSSNSCTSGLSSNSIGRSSSCNSGFETE